MSLERGTFLQEAQRRMPEKIITNIAEGRSFVEKYKKEESFLLDLCKDLNPGFSANERLVGPMLIYGTVDPVGNVSETLTMMVTAQKIGAKTAFLLDDVCHDLDSCHRRIMKDSYELLGMKLKRVDSNIRFNEVEAMRVLPDPIVEMLEENGLSDGASLAEAYECALYLLVEEVLGAGASSEITFLRASAVFSEDSVLGGVPLGELREMVKKAARVNKKEDLVFVHLNGEKIRTDFVELDKYNLSDLYKNGGSLGGTAVVAITTMFLDKSVFGENTHPLILAEKNTAFGGNFASVYEALLTKEHDAHRIAVSGVRRTKANKTQQGGDGIDPLVMTYLLKKNQRGPVYKKMLLDLVEDGFPLVEKTPRERELLVGDEATLKTAAIAMLKQKTGIDGGYVASLGVEYKKVGTVLLALADRWLLGELKNEDDVMKVISYI